MVDRTVVAVVRRYLDALSKVGIPAARAVLFGSYARGTQHALSDIDILVLSSQFDSRKDSKSVDIMWQVAADVDARIEPIPVGVREYETETWKPILIVARREGVPITLAGSTARIAAEPRAEYGAAARSPSGSPRRNRSRATVSDNHQRIPR